MKVNMKAVGSFPYAGKDLVPGDDFEADNADHATFLELAGKASRVGAPVEQPQERASDVRRRGRKTSNA